MSFRADEERESGRRYALEYLTRGFSSEYAQFFEGWLDDTIKRFGPVVTSYPSWHPLVCTPDRKCPSRRPSDDQGYRGLDHTIHFVNAFVTNPYDRAGTDVLRSVQERNSAMNHPFAKLNAQLVDHSMYHPDAQSVLVWCDWANHRDGQYISQRNAIGCLLHTELPSILSAEVGETWNTMHPYFLGSPHGKRSSLFVSEGTGNAMKRMWDALNNAGVFGPVYTAAR